jgi:hypothetical protein
LISDIARIPPFGYVCQYIFRPIPNVHR